MGARDFSSFADGATPSKAFEAAKAEARVKYGERYTGSVAEKGSFKTVPTPPAIAGDEQEVLRHAFSLIAEDDDLDDKYGPAGCMQVRPGRWLFFGMAPD